MEIVDLSKARSEKQAQAKERAEYVKERDTAMAELKATLDALGETIQWGIEDRAFIMTHIGPFLVSVDCDSEEEPGKPFKVEFLIDGQGTEYLGEKSFSTLRGALQHVKKEIRDLAAGMFSDVGPDLKP